MTNHYVFESLMQLQQKEIDQQARHAWKGLSIRNAEKVQKLKENLTPTRLEPVTACCPECC